MRLFSLFSGAKCYNCGQSWQFICPLCLPKIHAYEGFDYISKQKSTHFFIAEDHQKEFPLRQVVVLTRYHQKWVKTLLRHAKFYGKYRAYKDLIFPFKAFFHTHVKLNDSLLIPVPLHYFRRWKRWFNQSEKIADFLWEALAIPVNSSLLLRKKYTKHQSHLSKAERQTMLHSAFKLTKEQKNIAKNTSLYLIDDVISSGSTLLECAKTLRDAWYTDIRAIVLASD